MREILGDFMGLFYGEERRYTDREMFRFYAVFSVVLAMLMILSVIRL